MGRRNEHSRDELKALALRAAGDIVAERAAPPHCRCAKSRAASATPSARCTSCSRISTTSSCISTSRPSSSCARRSSGSAAARTSPRRTCGLLVAAYLGFALSAHRALAARVRASAARRAEGAADLRGSHRGHLRAGRAARLREAGDHARRGLDRRTRDRVVERCARHLHAGGHRQTAGGDAGFGATTARRVAGQISRHAADNTAPSRQARKPK